MGDSKKDRDPDAVAIGAKIKQAREARGMTQTDLGVRLQPPTSWRTVSKWERGEFVPKSPRREQIGVILGVDLGGVEGLTKQELMAELLHLRSRLDQMIARI